MRVFDDETFGVRLSCTIGLTVDHRVADGADAARMLAIITNLVATPEHLL
jgi:pyruvate dehydrogenase E2 component (dihydrolipoamide acetyltransferase)